MSNNFQNKDGIDEERIKQIKDKNGYETGEVYVLDPGYGSVSSFSLTPHLEKIIKYLEDHDLKEYADMVRKCPDKITEIIVGDRLKNGLPLTSSSDGAIHLDSSLVTIGDDGTITLNDEQAISTMIIQELLTTTSQLDDENISGILEYERDESGKILRKNNITLNSGIALYLAHKINGETIDSPSLGEEVASLLGDTVGTRVLIDSFVGHSGSLEQTLDTLAGEEGYFKRINKRLDTITRLNEAISRIENGKQVADSESLERMRRVAVAEQQMLAEDIFANTILPAVQRLPENERQVRLIPVMRKHEKLLEVVQKYVPRVVGGETYADFSDQNISLIREELNTSRLDFSRIVDVTRVVQDDTMSDEDVSTIREVANETYEENRDSLDVDRSTSLTPFLRRELEGFVVALDRMEQMEQTEDVKQGIANYKAFLHKYFDRIPDLDSEIERIREERKAKDDKKNPQQIVDETTEKAKRDAKERAHEKPKTDDAKEPDVSSKYGLKDRFIIDNTTGEIYDQRRLSIYDKAINISRATGNVLDIEDETLVALRNQSVEAYAKTLKPTPQLEKLYGDKWREVLIEAYTKGWTIGMTSEIQKAGKEGLQQRSQDIAKIESGDTLEVSQREVSMEEMHYISSNFEVTGDDKVVFKGTQKEVMSERTKSAVQFAKTWEVMLGDKAYTKENQETYQFIMTTVRQDLRETGQIDITKLQEEAAKRGESCSLITNTLVSTNIDMLESFARMQTPDSKQPEKSESHNK